MKAVGIICEYNPFHNGHIYHLEKVKELCPDHTIILVMSGNFLQRGETSLIQKWDKTKIALAYGVDLVKANILAAMGEEPKLEIHEQTGCFMTYVLHSHSDGIFRGVEFSHEILPFIYRKVLYKNEGDEVESFDGAGKALGIVFFHIDTKERMDYFINQLDDLIKVKVDNIN